LARESVLYHCMVILREERCCITEACRTTRLESVVAPSIGCNTLPNWATERRCIIVAYRTRGLDSECVASSMQHRKTTSRGHSTPVLVTVATACE
jgi:hypothetical protein